MFVFKTLQAAEGAQVFVFGGANYSHSDNYSNELVCVQGAQWRPKSDIQLFLAY
jgi:hypothetical protein